MNVMNNHHSRREFVKRCTAVGAAFVAAPSISRMLEAAFVEDKPEICSIVGDTYFENTVKAVDALGGMKRFVRKGNTVGLLINSPFGTTGTFTNPDIALAALKMCLDAGAKQVSVIHDTPLRYWRRSGLSEKMKTEIGTVAHSSDTKEITIDRGKSLKKAEVSQTFLSCDVYINLPIIKDHEGVRFTGAMKNVMGACTSSTCRFFHYGGKFSLFAGAYANVELLSQCIADVNTVRQPNLCLIDATEIITTNGPAGPGDVKKPREIIAATNGVAADMYAVRHLGLDPEELPVFKFAREHGIGPASLKNVSIKTI